MGNFDVLIKAVRQVKTVADDIENMNDREGPRYEPSIEVCVEIIRLQNEAQSPFAREINTALVPAQEADIAAALKIVKEHQPKASNPWATAV